MQTQITKEDQEIAAELVRRLDARDPHKHRNLVEKRKRKTRRLEGKWQRDENNKKVDKLIAVASKLFSPQIGRQLDRFLRRTVQNHPPT